MFEQYYGKAKELLVLKAQYKPFPSIDDRAVWDSLHPEQKAYYLEMAESYLDYDWPTIPATRYMDYYRNGNRSRYTNMESQRRAALLSLSIAECIENKGRFIDDIVNGIWVTLDEASWVGPAHNRFNPPAPDGRALPPTTRQEDVYVDHFAGDTGCMMAAILCFLQPRLDEVTPQICERLVYELDRRIVRPFVAHDDWHWMGTEENPVVNNWCPWVVSNCTAVMAVITEDDATRAAVLEKALKLDDRYMLNVGEDGSCDEGARYWGIACNAVFSGLDLFHGLTGGKIDLYKNEKIRKYAHFGTSLHIDKNQFTMFADNDRYLRLAMQGAWEIARKVGDQDLANMAVYMRPESYKTQMEQKQLLPGCIHMHAYISLKEMFNYSEYIAQPAVDAARPQDTWHPVIQTATARQKGGSVEGLFFAAKGGYNAESHNHNDIGTFILYSDGKPAIIDMGAGDYHADSFSHRRYEVNKQVNSGWHNLPMADGVQQKDGHKYAAKDVEYSCADGVTTLAMNIEDAYDEATPIAAWRRTYVFDRNAEQLILTDAYAMKQPAAVESVLMTAEEPVWADGVLRIPTLGGRAVVVKATEGWIPTVEKMDLSDDFMFRRDWDGKMFRVVYRPAEKVEKGEMTMAFCQEK